jgi:hypothetical protein
MNLEGAEWAVWRCSRGIWGTQRYPERSNRKILTNFRVASTSSWRPSTGRTIPEMQLNAAEQHSLIWQKSCDLIWHRSSRSLHHHTPHYLLRFGSTIDNVHSGWCLFKICWAINPVKPSKRQETYLQASSTVILSPWWNQAWPDLPCLFLLF